jgi:hypothetical protein
VYKKALGRLGLRTICDWLSANICCGHFVFFGSHNRQNLKKYEAASESTHQGVSSRVIAAFRVSLDIVCSSSSNPLELGGERCDESPAVHISDQKGAAASAEQELR